MKVIITVEGGLIQEIYADGPITVKVCDYDRDSFGDPVAEDEALAEYCVNTCTPAELVAVEETCRKEFARR